MKLIIDVDTGIDDALALLYVLASPEAELLAVTCTSGNVEAAQVADNTIALLEMAGRGDIEVALGRRNAFQWEINGSRGALSFDMERMNELQVFLDGESRTRGFRTSAVDAAATVLPSSGGEPNTARGDRRVQITVSIMEGARTVVGA